MTQPHINIYIYIHTNIPIPIHIHIHIRIRIFKCIKTKEQRDRLKHRINKTNKLQDYKKELITKHRKVYSEFIESIDFDKLQDEQ